MSQKVLLTGANGFLGKYINKALIEQGYDVITLGRTDADIVCNLAKEIPVITNEIQAIVHAAGKAHVVPKTEEEKHDFFAVNLKGTENLLKALDELAAKPKTFVFISTVAVYGLDTGENTDEFHPLNATDPYGISKIKAEQVIENWCKKNAVNYFMLRLPLIAGDNPPGNLGSMINAIKKGYYFRIGAGKARKSIVLAEDVARFIPELFSKNNSGAYNLTDGHNPSFAAIEDKIAGSINKKVAIKIPSGVAKLIAAAGSFIPKFPLTRRQFGKITSPLTFSDAKAQSVLGWQPRRFLDV
ncbi:MAG TPA: NAD-dependent epimerase/dehydratase family protein [Bacteroidia bacterium]|nr:NAD-dependent epimerase/dehydratase family protein [Bacteroidia bacterium]